MKITRLCAASLCGLLLLTGVQSRSALHKDHFTGTQMFAGIFFDRGPAATLLPEPSRDRQPPDVSQNELSAIESRISHRDPHFFDRFGRDISSGDPGLVGETFRSAASAIRAAVNVNPYHNDRTSAFADGRDAAKTATSTGILTIDSTTATDNTYVGIVIIDAIGCQDVYVGVSQCPNVHETSFRRDALIQLLTRRFASVTVITTSARTTES